MIYWLIATLLLALGLFQVGMRVSRGLEPDFRLYVSIGFGAALAMPGIIFAAYYLEVFSEPVWLYKFRSLPFSELAAGGAGFLAGLLHGRFAEQPRFRRIAGRWFFPGVLLLGLVVPYVKPILRPARWDLFQDRWSDEICLQTSESSCGPACAATLLRVFGKSATEADLAREAHTSRSGTENWYLVRALRQRGMVVRFQLSSGESERLPFPSIAGVRLSNLGNSGHFITVLGREGDAYVIGDPLEGKLVLTRSALESKYAFTGFFIVFEGKSAPGTK